MFLTNSIFLLLFRAHGIRHPIYVRFMFTFIFKFLFIFFPFRMEDVGVFANRNSSGRKLFGRSLSELPEKPKFAKCVSD